MRRKAKVFFLKVRNTQHKTGDDNVSVFKEQSIKANKRDGLINPQNNCGTVVGAMIKAY